MSELCDLSFLLWPVFFIGALVGLVIGIPAGAWIQAKEKRP